MYPKVVLIEDRKAEIHEYRRVDTGEKIPSVSEIKTAMGLQNLDSIPMHVLLNARDRGIVVHDVCHKWDEKTLKEDKVHPDVKPYLEAYKLFCADKKVEVLYSEKTVYSLENNYAGTLDRVYRIDGKNILVDLKATSTVHNSYGLQLGFYTIACEEQEGICINERWVVQLLKTGLYKIYNVDNPKCQRKLYDEHWREAVVNMAKRYHSRIKNGKIDTFKQELYSF